MISCKSLENKIWGILDLTIICQLSLKSKMSNGNKGNKWNPLGLQVSALRKAHTVCDGVKHFVGVKPCSS